MTYIFCLRFIISTCLSGYFSYLISSANNNYYFMFLMIPFIPLMLLLTFLLFVLYCYIVSLFMRNKKVKYHKYMDYLLKEFDNSLMKLLRIKVVEKGFDKIKNQNVLYVANHTSNFDPLIMINAIPYKLSIVSKPENFKIPFIGKMIRACGYISINRDNPREGAKAIFKARDFLKNNDCNVLIFPEGTRNKTKEILLPMHAGSFKPAFSAKKDVVVCSIKNVSKIHFGLKKTKIIVNVIDVLNPEDYDSDVFMRDKVEELIKQDLLNNAE